MLDIAVFSGDWPASKAQVVALLQGIEAGRIASPDECTPQPKDEA